ncbi:MAG TPA: ABC transporter ATP-binding protein [Candidatus Saccharimonadales bacterium]
MTAISFASVSKTFGSTKAVREVSFEVEKGEVIGFVGPNGAGKTTSISMLMGFIRPHHGEITLLGTKVRPQSAHSLHNRVGFAAGDMALFDNTTGQQYLDFMAHASKAKPTAREALIADLQPILHKPIKQLSRGNKQKIALIGALQHEPEVLILDEPTSGLDPLMQDIFMGIIGESQKKGTTVLMSSHILSEVAHSCDRVLFMKHGQIIMNRSVDELEEQQGKIVTIAAPTETLELVAKELPKDAVELKQAEHTVRFRYTGEMKPLLAWLSKLKGLSDTTITKQDLDDIFHELYQDEEPKI